MNIPMSIPMSIQGLPARRLAVAALLTLGTGTAAHAHAFLRHAMPAVGGTVAAAPPELTLDYTEAVEPRFSHVEVLDARGQHVDAGDLHPAPDDPKRLIVGLKPLPPGSYTVKWRVVAADTHHTEGTFTFSVRP
jgi:methionine-rich copper-binding protein CopC